MYQNIIFDFGNVLHEWNPEYLATYYTTNKEDASILLNTLFKYWDELNYGFISNHDFFEKIAKQIPERLHQTTKDIINNFYLYMKPIPGMKELIKDLKKNHSIYLLSNAPIAFYNNYQKMSILKDFDGIVISAKEKLAKPNQNIFDFILNKYHLNKKDCLFIDDLKINIEGATKSGIDGYQFDDANHLREYLIMTQDLEN